MSNFFLNLNFRPKIPYFSRFARRTFCSRGLAYFLSRKPDYFLKTIFGNPINSRERGVSFLVRRDWLASATTLQCWRIKTAMTNRKAKKNQVPFPTPRSVELTVTLREGAKKLLNKSLFHCILRQRVAYIVAHSFCWLVGSCVPSVFIPVSGPFHYVQTWRWGRISNL